MGLDPLQRQMLTATAIDSTPELSWLRNEWSPSRFLSISSPSFIGAFLCAHMPQTPGLHRFIGFLQLTFKGFTVRFDQCSKGCLVSVHLGKSNSSGKHLWGRITVWEGRNFSYLTPAPPQHGRAIVSHTSSQWLVCSLFTGCNFLRPQRSSSRHTGKQGHP